MAKKTPYKMGKLEGLRLAKKIAIENGASEKVVNKIKRAQDKLLQS